MSKADGCVDVHDGDFSGCTLTTILCSSMPWDDPVFWTDASAVKDAVERLSEVERDWTQPLDEVKDQLSTNPNRHGEFLQFGGVKASPHTHSHSFSHFSHSSGTMAIAKKWEQYHSKEMFKSNRDPSH